MVLLGSPFGKSNPKGLTWLEQIAKYGQKRLSDRTFRHSKYQQDSGGERV